MEMKIPAIAITAVVVVIVLAGVLMPVLDDATATETTFTNEGYYTLDKVDGTTTRVITWERANPNQIKINGEILDMSFAEVNKSYTLIGSDTLVVRYMKDNSTTGIQAFSDTTYVSFHLQTDVSAGDVATITISEGAVTFVSDGTSALNRNLGSIGTDCYSINANGTGEYSVMKKSDVPAYVFGDSEIKLIGVSVAGGPSGIALYGSGTLDDGMTISTIYKPNTVTTVTYSDAISTDSEVSGYDDLYKIEKYEFTITYDTSSYDAVYSYFIVPSEVTAEKSVHFTDNQNMIFAAIPIMVIVALLIAVVALVFRGRDF